MTVSDVNLDITHPSVCGGVPATMACSDVQCYCLEGEQLVVTAGKTVRQSLSKSGIRDVSELQWIHNHVR